jgi:hypothetical protein
MLTDAALRALKPGKTISDASARGDLGLEVKRLAGGGLSWRAVYSSQRRTHRIALGVNLGLRAARDARDALRARVEGLRQRFPDLARVNDLHGMLDADDAERAAKAEAAKQLAEQRRTATLEALMRAYVADLQARGRVRWREVEGSIRKHVIEAHPDLAAKAAAEITHRDCAAIVRGVVDAGHVREAAKIRSYLRAAYTAAVRAADAPDGLRALADLRLETNPASNVPTLRGGQGTPHERALSLTELQSYWRRIQGEPLLLLHLLTGGQRVAQLARATTGDLDRQEKTLTLRDPKGRRETARLHVVPVLDEALSAIDAMPPIIKPFHVFTATAGKFGAHYQTINDRLRPIVAAMIEAGEATEPFTLGDLRRTS